jgi:hypothetical protein
LVMAGWPNLGVYDSPYSDKVVLCLKLRL